MKEPTSDLPAALSKMVSQLEKLALVPNQEQLAQLGVFCTLLAEYNEHTNLVSRADPHTLVSEHILDAWSMVPTINRWQLPGRNWLIDIGSGAGFPGLILSIALPDLKVVLVESITKKARFLEQAVGQLGLGRQVQIVNDRAESLSRDQHYRGQFTLATARAVGTMDLVSELALPLLSVPGYLLLPKSKQQVELECRLAKSVLLPLGGQLEEIESLQEVVGKEHVLLVIKKFQGTPERYPRPLAQIKRKPLSGMDKW